MSYIIIDGAVINTDDVPVDSAAFREAWADGIDALADKLDAGDAAAWALWWSLFEGGEATT